jgi:hypothetical protein
MSLRKMLMLTKGEEVYLFMLGEDKDHRTKMLRLLADMVEDPELSIDWHDASFLLKKLCGWDQPDYLDYG